MIFTNVKTVMKTIFEWLQAHGHRLAFAGIENPRVMKSLLVPDKFLGSREEKRPFRFSFVSCFLRFFDCSCS